MIPLNKDEHKYNTKSYGCHEYYNQENDFKQILIHQFNKIKINIKRSKLTKHLVIWSTHR